MPATSRIIRKADRRAQRRFHRYFENMMAGNPDNGEWRAYIEAEDAFDALRGVERRADAAHDAADWRLSAETGQYATLPDVPLADPGDHFAGMPS